MVPVLVDAIPDAPVVLASEGPLEGEPVDVGLPWNTVRVPLVNGETIPEEAFMVLFMIRQPVLADGRARLCREGYRHADGRRAPKLTDAELAAELGMVLIEEVAP